MSGSLGDARPALRFREMTIERHCHAGLENPGRDLAIATICSTQFWAADFHESMSAKRPKNGRSDGVPTIPEADDKLKLVAR